MSDAELSGSDGDVPSGLDMPPTKSSERSSSREKSLPRTSVTKERSFVLTAAINTEDENHKSTSDISVKHSDLGTEAPWHTHPLQRALTATAPVSYFVLLLLPLIFCIVLYCLIPVADNDNTGVSQLVFILTVLPLSAFAISFAYTSLLSFLTHHVDKNSWHEALIPAAAVAIIEVVILGPLVFFFGNFWFISIPFALIIWIGTPIGQYGLMRGRKYGETTVWLKAFILRILLPIAVQVVALVGYLVLFVRLQDSVVQNVLSATIGFVTAMNRRVMLSLLDPFDMEIQLFISGFWMQNLYDMFQIFSLTAVVRESQTYPIVWGVTVLGNVLYLWFLTDTWFWLRIRIKHLFVCLIKRRSWDPPEPDTTVDYLDRGHSLNKPGYHRRYIRWLYWKVVGQCFALIFYLCIAPVMFFGPNSGSYPNLSDRRVVDNIIFAAGLLISVVVSSALLFVIIYFWKKEDTRYVMQVHWKLLKEFSFLGLMVAMLTHNAVIPILIFTRQFRLWKDFKNL
eukprot:TRINITY_DN15287_c0_g1_i1.p1 TRINITY_DN15287_c0_g1~~TRINITY_DN15287_c0_g1_i1.p1  ORF type:complete len:510 (+),score=64.20 TRINITY_DN15287_c0_g1_i1:224-1753(+)